MLGQSVPHLNMQPCSEFHSHVPTDDGRHLGPAAQRALQLTSDLRIGAGFARAFYLTRLQLNLGVSRLQAQVPMRTAPYWLALPLVIGPQPLMAQQTAAHLSCEPARLFSAEPCRPPVFSAAVRVGTLDARLQMVIPTVAPVEYTVVIVGGGLVGHVAFTTEIWRDMCARFHCALAHFDVEPAAQPQALAQDPGRNAAVGSGEALLALLDTVARTTARPELARAKVALFGFSATGSFAITFASLHPERTLTAVRYHSHLRGLGVDTPTVARVPILIVASADDSTAGVDDARTFWRAGRRAAAPWALAVETGRAHLSLDSWYAASDLIWHWIDATNRRAVTVAGGQSDWFGDMSTNAISRTVSGRAPDTVNWFPDSGAAEAWRRMSKR